MRKYNISHERSPVWAKMAAVEEAFATFPSAEWVWWLDMDAIIMTPSLELYEHLLDPEVMKTKLLDGEEIVSNDRIREPYGQKFRTGEVCSHVLPTTDHKTTNPSEIDIICTQDLNGMNLGSFIIRNSQTMSLLVDLWSDILLVDYSDQHWLLKEQDLLLHLIFEHPVLRKRMGWVQQNVINAYWFGDDRQLWKPGDLVIHFPDCQ
jgi:galactosyl transferase GMA12/MNN10 family